MRIVIQPYDFTLFDAIVNEIEAQISNSNNMGKIGCIGEDSIYFTSGEGISGHVMRETFKGPRESAYISPDVIEFFISFGTSVASGIVTTFILYLLKKFKSRMSIEKIDNAKFGNADKPISFLHNRESEVISQLIDRENDCKFNMVINAEIMNYLIDSYYILKKFGCDLDYDIVSELKLLDNQLFRRIYRLIQLIGSYCSNIDSSKNIIENYLRIMLLPRNEGAFTKLTDQLKIPFIYGFNTECHWTLHEINENGIEFLQSDRYKITVSEQTALSPTQKHTQLINIDIEFRSSAHLDDLASSFIFTLGESIVFCRVVQVKTSVNGINYIVPATLADLLQRETCEVEAKICNIIERRALIISQYLTQASKENKALKKYKNIEILDDCLREIRDINSKLAHLIEIHFN